MWGGDDDEGASYPPECGPHCDVAVQVECAMWTREQCMIVCASELRGEPQCQSAARAYYECAATEPLAGWDCRETLAPGGTTLVASYALTCCGTERSAVWDCQ